MNEKTDMSTDPRTVTDLCNEIDEIGRKANRLIEGVCEQRDDARKRLVEANSMLRTCYAVIQRKGMETNWEPLDKRLLDLLERQRLAINEFHGFTDERYNEGLLGIRRVTGERTSG